MSDLTKAIESTRRLVEFKQSMKYTSVPSDYDYGQAMGLIDGYPAADVLRLLERMERLNRESGGETVGDTLIRWGQSIDDITREEAQEMGAWMQDYGRELNDAVESRTKE